MKQSLLAAFAEAPLAPELVNPPEHALQGLVTLYTLGRLDEARDCAAVLIAAYPHGEILCNIAGAIQVARGCIEDGVALFDKALALAPDYAEAHNNRGNALKDQHRPADALASYDQAIHYFPAYAEAHVNRGIALRMLNRPLEALASYDKALLLNPQLAEAYSNRGNALLDLERMDEALADYETAVPLRQNDAAAMSDLLARLAYMCRWKPIERAAEQALIDATGAVIAPFHMLRMADDPARQRIAAALWSARRYGPGQPVAFPTRQSDAKIRIGYFSADFHNHATMNLIVRMLELHDKSRFEIHAFSYGIDAQDAMRARLLATVDAFHDVRALGDADIAALSRAEAIDIAIDLKGHTDNTRSGIFAHRAAPDQVNYLGYPGTMGAEFIDHIIADRIVIPEEDCHHYSEQVAYLPGSYQANDDQRAIADRLFTRAELGLPERGFVFCSFNDSYKISPAEFDIWMRLLGKVEGSVLWLLEGTRWAAQSLRREAQARGVDPARLIFAEKLPVADHLARHRCADLFLDTFNVNAHTTASDALWTGLPIVTKLGASFVSRVAGSLLHAIGMPELVTDTAQAYEQLALDLASNPARLAATKAKLQANRLTTSLFETAQYTRDIEQLYETIYRSRIDEKASLPPHPSPAGSPSP